MKHLAKKKKEKRMLSIGSFFFYYIAIGVVSRGFLNTKFKYLFFPVVVATVRYGTIYQKALVEIN